MAGRKPLPVAVKKIKGTLQKCRTNPNEPRPRGKLGDPPEYMSDIAKEAWTYAVENAPPGLLSSLDAAVLAQAQRLKRYSQEGKLSEDVMSAIMSEEKKEVDRIFLTSDKLKQYFPKSYTPRQMEETIFKLLEQWQQKRERDMER